VSDESWNLGADLDRYVQAIGAATTTSEGKQHASVFRRLSDILIAGVGAQDQDIENAIEELKRVQE
jgi:hypothetical protein